MSGKESYIPHTFSNTKAKKPWFNSAYSRAVKDRLAAHKRYRRNPSAETDALDNTKNSQKTLSSIGNVKTFPIICTKLSLDLC